MDKSTNDEISRPPAAAAHRSPPAGLVAIVLGIAGPLVALALGLLTFGVQATVQPHHLPLAIGASSVSSAAALAPVTSRVAAQGGDAVDWRAVDSRAQAEGLLDRKDVYGAVLFDPAAGGLTATVLLSGAVNPSATQVAESVLSQVAETVTSASRAQAAQAGRGPAATAAAPLPAVRVVTIHPASPAGRTLPLAASALLWLATLITNTIVIVAGPRLRGGRPLGDLTRLGAAVTAALLGTGVVLGLARLWDSGLTLGWEVTGFMALVGLAFALLQAGVLRWLGLAGLVVLGPLYLMAPATAGLVPELLNPVYRWALWSWTPFRFSTEALRSLLFLGRDAPDVQPALWVFGGIGLAGLLLAAVPRPRRRTLTPERPGGGGVAVHQGS